MHRHIGTELEGYVGIVIVFDVLYNFHRCNSSKNVPNSHPSNHRSSFHFINTLVLRHRHYPYNQPHH
jgi:hypothetical protein